LYSGAQEYSSGTDVAPYQLVSRQAGQEPEDDPVGQNEAMARSNAFFAALASRPDLLDESSRFLDRTHDPFARTQDDEQHPVSADETDPSTAHGGNNAPNLPNAPSNNDAAPKNLAGANPNAGAGQGPGGVSTPNPSGGGGGGGGGGGTPAGGNLATLANEGAFANPSLGNSGGHGATMTPQVQTNTATNALTPGGDPPLPFTEGVSAGQVITTFTDADGNTNPSNYSANINWGNGQTTTGMVSYNSSSGQFQVYGTMTYAEEGSYPISVTINDSDGNQTTATATAAVGDAALTSSLGYPISVTAGQAFNGSLGEFNDANTSAPASDFTVSVNWGDGSASSAGTVTASGGSGGFIIGGSHTYTTAGTYDVTATVTDVGGSQTTVSTTANVTSGLTPGSSAMVSFVEGNAATVQVATFTDGDGNTNPSNYSASINWGNGQTTTGTVQYNSSSGQFQVYGTMTYADEGNYPIGVTINDSDGAGTTATASASVGDAALTAGTTGPLSLTVGQAFNGTVASFNDANTSAPASDFTASIAWGDGNTSTGTVTAQGNGAFLVGGSHTYATAGTYPISVTITDVGGSQTTAGNSANVTAASGSVPFTIYNTGVDNTGTVLADGSVDPHYQITAAPSPYSPGNAYVVDQSSFPFTNSPPYQWQADGDNLSKWIGPVANEANDPSGTYTYQTTFDLTGYNPASAVITGQYSTDNWLSEIILNGQVVDSFPNNGASEYSSWQTLPQISSDFVAGVNTLDFVAINDTQTSDNPTGLRVELNGTAVKEPTVQFAMPTYGVGEQNGSATIDVTLSQTYTQSVSVAYATANGSAVAGTDYTATSGTVTFAPGQTIQSFSVPILDDGLSGETSPETVALTLSSPSNAALGSQATAVLDIDENLDWQGPSYTWTQTTVAPPSVAAPAAQTNTENDNVSVQVQASDSNGYTLSYDALDLPPGLSINSTTGLISGTVQYGAAADFGGSYNPTIIVDDGHGGSAQASFAWTINQITNPAQADPTIANPGSQTNLRGDAVSLQVNATQVDGDALTYDATNLPVGLSIDSQTGIISGTVDPSSTLGTPYAVTVTATDEATNLSSSQTFNWTVSAANVAPVLTSPGNQTNAAGDVVSLQLAATDADGDSLTYTASGLPPGLTLDPIAGTITGTLPNSAASSMPYNVTVTASDGQSSNSQFFQWSVNAISLPAPGDQSNLDGDSVSLQMSGTDAGSGTLTYSAYGLPSGLSIDSTTGLISGTISTTADMYSPYSVTVAATDGTNNASQSFNWTVAKLALNAPSDQQNQEGTAVSLQLSATDNGGTPTYSATGLPPGLSINSSGLISGTVGLGAFGSSPYQVTATATDGSSSSSQSFVWTVTPRVALVNPGSQNNASGDSVSVQVSATSPGGTMSYSASGLPTGLSINSSTGLISGTLASGDANSSPYSVTVTANDGTSSSSQTFQWTVSAINLVSPGDQTNNDGDTVSLSLTTGYHGTGTLSYTATGLPTGLSISSTTGQITGTISATADTNSPYSVAVTATDGTNTSSQSFNWTVNAVVSVASLGDQSNAVGDAVSLQVTAGDALNGTLTYSATGLPSGLTISSTTGLISGTIAVGADSGSPYTVTVTATDSAGLSATQSFNWTVAHLSLVNPGSLQSLDGATVSLQLQGGDADGQTVSYTATGLPTGLSISSTGLVSGTIASNADINSPYNVAVTASDGTNTTTQTFLWTVGQVVLTAPSDLTNTEGDTVSLQLQGATSNGSLTYSASGLPPGLSLNATTGLITGTIAVGDAANGPYTVDVSATNGMVSTSQTFTWTVNPVVNLTAPADQSNNEGDSVSLQLSATDSHNATLTYTAVGLPSGLSISSAGMISGTISSGDSANGPYVVTVTATDGTYSASQTFDWSIARTDTTALTMTAPSTQTNVAGDSVNLQVGASDPDGDALTYSASGLPEGLGIDPATGIISGTIADGAVDTTPYSVTVTAGDANGQSISQTFNWLVNDPALSVQVGPVNAVEGNDTGPIPVATFTTLDLNAQAGDFSVLIDWGDGVTDVGSITGQGGSFTVTGDHTYVETGSYPVSVILTDDTGANTTASGTTTVADAALTLTGGFQLGAVMGQSSTLTPASFTDSNPSAPASDYNATINWGDGSGTQSATVSDSGDGVFSIGGSHDYSQNGTYTTTITVTDADGATATTTSTVVVGNVYAGIPSNLTVASFTDADTSVPASSFTATINWGDGSQSSGVVSGGNGTFTVQGTHTYAVDSIAQSGGVYPVSVTVSDTSGNTLTSNSSVSVVRPTASLVGDAAAGTQEVALTNVAVASFTEPDVSDGVGEYSATINWGDGSGQNAGTIVEVSPGVFEVQGSHTYALAGEYTVQVFLDQGWVQYYYVTTCQGLVWVEYKPSTPPSNEPVANDDYYVVKDGTAKGWVLANDQNSASDSLNTKLEDVKTRTAPAFGKLTWDANNKGNFTYTPYASFKGSDSFTYWVSNGQGRDYATVYIGTAAPGYVDAVTTGNPKGEYVYPKQAGYVMQGGGTAVAAEKWLIEHAGGGRIVLLADSMGPNLPEDEAITQSFVKVAQQYNLKMGKVELIDFNETTTAAKQAAQLQSIYNDLVNAGAIFILGGNQWRYINIWQGTKVQAALNDVIGKTTIGGTSAGCAVLGNVVYYPAAQPSGTTSYDGITSPIALHDPFSGQIAFKQNFVKIPALQSAITDTHFGLITYGVPGADNLSDRQRYGRMMVFLARMMQPGGVEYLKGADARGLGVDADTAVLLNANGVGQVVGSGFAYFFVAKQKPLILKNTKPPTPLTYGSQTSPAVKGFMVWGGNARNSVDMSELPWTIYGGLPISMWANAGDLFINGLGKVLPPPL
jgi:cyanophycinase-like exopeptidase